MRLSQLFRPVYGEQFHARPKHWWNPKQRKSARLAAMVCDHKADEIKTEVAERLTHELMYGGPKRDN